MKETLGELQVPIVCGGVTVYPNDMVIADEEGIAVIPKKEIDKIWQIAKERTEKDAAQSLESWAHNHRVRIEQLLAQKGFEAP